MLVDLPRLATPGQSRQLAQHGRAEAECHDSPVFKLTRVYPKVELTFNTNWYPRVQIF